jgi:hypothetical protein
MVAILNAIVKYAPLATALALVFAVFQYVQISKRNKAALINSLFEALKHNLNIRRGLFFVDSAPAIAALGKEIRSLGKDDFYPNPSDSTETRGRLYEAISYVDNDKLEYATEYMPLLVGSAKSAFESGNGHRILTKRIMLNLGHLHFGLERNNIRLKSFNRLLANLVPATEVVTSGFKDDYMTWVHFRQYFVLLDLVMSYPASYFSDRGEYDKLKSALG